MITSNKYLLRTFIQSIKYNFHNSNKKTQLYEKVVFNKFITHKNLYFKAKQQQQPKKGGKTAQKAQTPAVVETVSTLINGMQFLRPKANCLSSEQWSNLQNGFEDLSVQDKQLLDQLAEQIIRFKSSTFFRLVQDGGLGTQDCLYVNQKVLTQEQLKQNIVQLRKDN